MASARLLAEFNRHIGNRAYSKAADILRPINDDEAQRRTFADGTRLYNVFNDTASKVEILFGPDHEPVIITDTFAILATELREHLDRSQDIENEPLDVTDLMRFFEALVENEDAPQSVRIQSEAVLDRLSEDCDAPSYQA